MFLENVEFSVTNSMKEKRHRMRLHFNISIDVQERNIQYHEIRVINDVCSFKR